MIRLKAAGVHLGYSVLAAALASFLIFQLWYPAPLHLASGVGGLVVLLIGVDAVIGPLLTLIVYQPQKKSLRFDLAVIVVLQASALLYGMKTIADGRPVWLVFNADRFDAVPAYMLDERRLQNALPEFRVPPRFGPGWAAALLPESVDQRNSLLFESVFAGVDLAQRPDLYRPLPDALNEIKRAALPLSKLYQFNPEARVKEVLAFWPRADAYLPLMGRVQGKVVLIERQSAQPVAIVDLNPWD